MPVGQEQNEKLVQFTSKLKNAAGAQLASIVLYGSSAANGEFQAGFSDLNVLLVLRSDSADALKALSTPIRWWREQGEPAPVILTQQELRQAADVFAIELMDMKERHRVLEGDDVLATIDIPRNMHRVQVERELRTALVKLRQAYVQAKDDQAVSRLMTESVSTFATLFRHALIVFGESAPAEKRAAIEQIGKSVNADVSAMLRVLEIREKKSTIDSCQSLFADYLTTAVRVTDEVDRRLG
jgi:hypothetical protein